MTDPTQHAIVKFSVHTGGSWTIEDLQQSSGHWVVWSGRYGDGPPDGEPYPDRVFVPGHVGFGRQVAAAMSDWFAGMDYAYVVEGDVE